MNNYFNKSTGLFGKFGEVWDFLTKHHSSITNIAEQRAARLAASFLFSITLLAFTGGLARTLRMGVAEAYAGPIGISLLVLLPAYFISRTKWYRVAVFLFAVSFSSLAYVAMITQGNEVDYGAQVLIYVPTSLIVASTFLSWPAVFLLVGLNIGAYLSIQFFGVALPENIGAQAGMVTVNGVVLMLLTNFRKNSENTRLEEVNETTRKLETLTASLEQRIVDRTKELEDIQTTVSKRAVELQAVAEISTKASQAVDEQEMLQTVVEETKKSYNLYHAHIYLIDETGTELELSAGAGEVGSKMVDEKRKIALDHPHSLVARAARTIEGAISNDVANEPDFLPNPLLPNTKAEMAIPIAIGGRLLGILDVQADYVNRFTDEDIAIKTTLAQQVAASLESIRQFATSQKVARELGVVANISTATAAISDANTLLQEVVDKTKEAFDLYHVHIYLLEEDENVLKLASGAGEVGRQMVSEGRQIPLDREKSLVARAARTRAGVTVNDVRADPDFLPNPLLPETRSEMAVPMIVGDRVTGVLDVQSEHLGRFTEIDINIKTTLAAQVAVALQNARSFAQARTQAEQEALLNTITQRIQGTTTVEAALQMTARELGLILGKRQTYVALDMNALNNENKAASNE